MLHFIAVEHAFSETFPKFQKESFSPPVKMAKTLHFLWLETHITHEILSFVALAFYIKVSYTILVPERYQDDTEVLLK